MCEDFCILCVSIEFQTRIPWRVPIRPWATSDWDWMGFVWDDGWSLELGHARIRARFISKLCRKAVENSPSRRVAPPVHCVSRRSISMVSWEMEDIGFYRKNSTNRKSLYFGHARIHRAAWTSSNTTGIRIWLDRLKPDIDHACRRWRCRLVATICRFRRLKSIQ